MSREARYKKKAGNGGKAPRKITSGPWFEVYRPENELAVYPTHLEHLNTIEASHADAVRTANWWVPRYCQGYLWRPPQEHPFYGLKDRPNTFAEVRQWILDGPDTPGKRFLQGRIKAEKPADGIEHLSSVLQHGREGPQEPAESPNEPPDILRPLPGPTGPPEPIKADDDFWAQDDDLPF